MTTDLDWRLEAAIRPLVTERVAPSVIADVGGFGMDVRSARGALRVSQPLVIAALLLLLLAATWALIWSAGGPSSPLSPRQAALAAANGAPLVMTADGPVYLRRTADGSHVQLLLQPEPGDPIVLASVADPELQGVQPSLSGYPVVCPASSGLHQARYLFGQASQVTGSLFLQGIRGQAAGVSQKMWLIAVDESSVPAGKWSFGIAEPRGMGYPGQGDVWAGLRAGDRGIVQSPAGCLSGE